MRYKGTNKDSKSLESYKIFPVIAWSVTIGFAYFVYTLSLDLRDAIQDIHTQTEATQRLLEENLNRLENSRPESSTSTNRNN
jgi:hypothetical protein